MSLGNIFDMLQQYAGGAASTAEPEKDFDHVSQQASPQHLASGLASAFRSDSTPPFAEIISKFFSNSNGEQRAGILGHLLNAADPAARGALGDLPGGIGNGVVTPEQAQQISPDAVRDLAQQAEKSNPSVIEMAGEFYAQHPTLVKSLGAGALAMVMSHMSQHQR